jgi:hypothetical protein
MTSHPLKGPIVAKFLRAREAEDGIDAACLDASVLIGSALRYVLDVAPTDAHMLLESAKVELSAAIACGSAETPPSPEGPTK